LVKKDTISDM